MVTGWQKLEKDWYYFKKSGAMVRDQWVGDYYLKKNGKMAVDEWIGDKYVDSTGKYVPDKVK